MTDSTCSVTVLHVNDLHEIVPMAGGKLGGLARVATLRQQLLAKSRNLLVTFAGDLFGPSVFSTATINGTPLEAEHAVAGLNLVGIDYMTFGDHEIDQLSATGFYQRLSELDCSIISSNIFAPSGGPFPGVAPNAVVTVPHEHGQNTRIGIFGLTGKILFPGEVAFHRIDPLEAAQQQVKILADQVDVLIALTHQSLTDDVALAERFPDIDLILGGHDHQAMAVNPGMGLASIYKSDSNARAAYVLTLQFEKKTETLVVRAELCPLDEEIQPDPLVEQEIAQWVTQAFRSLRASGLDPDGFVANTPVDLDGLASSIRSKRTALTERIMDGVLSVAEDAELALLCSWLVRIDDLIPAGSDITHFDILRIFPVVNPAIITVEMSGNQLKNVLDVGRDSQGTGFYLLTNAGVEECNCHTGWCIDGVPLHLHTTYRVAVSADFPVDFLGTHSLGDVQIVTVYTDLRQALIRQLQKSSKYEPLAVPVTY